MARGDEASSERRLSRVRRPRPHPNAHQLCDRVVEPSSRARPRDTHFTPPMRLPCATRGTWHDLVLSPSLQACPRNIDSACSDAVAWQPKLLCKHRSRACGGGGVLSCTCVCRLCASIFTLPRAGKAEHARGKTPRQGPVSNPQCVDSCFTRRSAKEADLWRFRGRQPLVNVPQQRSFHSTLRRCSSRFQRER